MELLDIYDEQGNYLGEEDRKVVHEKGLWHKTVHCWLYDEAGHVFFQRRSDRHTLYTTASGHLKAKETVKEAFKREIKEEIGISIDSSDATFVAVVPFKMDRVKDDGSLFKDRAFANVYVDLYEGNYQDFALDKEEVLSLVLVDAKEALELFKKETGSIKGLEITYDNKKIEKEIAFSEFLVNDGETAFEKYGQILAKIIEITQTR